MVKGRDRSHWYRLASGISALIGLVLAASGAGWAAIAGEQHSAPL